jgi:small subunit ribosomal protein S15
LVERALDSALDFLQDGEAEVEEEDDELDMFEIYEESPDFEINYDLIKEYENKEAEALANHVPSAMDGHNVNIKAAVAKWRKHENDVGSMEVQIATANERIKYLTQHLLKNREDKAAKRGLDNLVTARRKALNYLYNTDRAKAEEMVKALGIRYRPPGQLWDKNAKYAAFKNTKSKYMRLRLLAKQERDARAKESASV